MRFKMEGIVTAMVTPFTRGGEFVDFDKIAGIAEGILGFGVHGLFVCGTTGEGLLMHADERREVLREALSVARKRAKVIAHTGALDTATTIELTRDAAEAGAHAAAIVAPSFYPYDDRAIEEYYAAIAKAVPDFPVFLYNIPGFARNKISIDSVLRLAEAHDNIVGIKDSSGDMCYLGKLIAAVPKGFLVFNGCDEFGHQALAAGCVGAVSGTSNAFGDIYVKLFNAARANKHDEARKQQHRLNRVCAGLTYGGTLAMFKQAMRLRGIEAGYTRPPQRSLTAQEKKVVAALVDELKLRAK
jgi:dihydrodipicolinate synthase/N-acetylneuraminate lyase